MLRLKDDEYLLLHAIQVGTVASVRLSSDRRIVLMRRFKAAGVLDEAGALTPFGVRSLSRQERLYPAELLEEERPHNQVVAPVATTETPNEERHTDDFGEIAVP